MSKQINSKQQKVKLHSCVSPRAVIQYEKLFINWCYVRSFLMVMVSLQKGTFFVNIRHFLFNPSYRMSRLVSIFRLHLFSKNPFSASTHLPFMYKLYYYSKSNVNKISINYTTISNRIGLIYRCSYFSIGASSLCRDEN